MVVLLRAGASTRLIGSQLSKIEFRQGALLEPESLKKAVAGVTHVIHCAGCTRSLTRDGFFEVNARGTGFLISSLDVSNLERIVHVSSLAAAGPAISSRPSREDGFPMPVSAYGESKLAAEKVVREMCPARHVILRPPAIYGPRDAEFFRLFQAVRRHLRPRPAAQELSLVYVKDFAEAAVAALGHPAAAGRTFNVACPEVVTARRIAEEIALQMDAWTVPVPLPNVVFWSLCLAQECLSRVTRRANVLNMQKYAELSAPGWVCNTERVWSEIGVKCETTLEKGIASALEWYRENRWL